MTLSDGLMPNDYGQNHVVIPGQAAGLRPEPRTDALGVRGSPCERVMENPHRLRVPGSSLTRSPGMTAVVQNQVVTF